MPPELEHDLPWTAFLYAAGDLADDEAARFEALLDEDQDARDAVARAVELAGALAVVAPEFRRSRRSRRAIGRRLLIGTAALAAAAGLVIALGPWFRAARPDASEIALAWTSLREAGDTAAPVEGPATEADEGDEADRALPSWLLSATSQVTPGGED